MVVGACRPRQIRGGHELKGAYYASAKSVEMVQQFFDRGTINRIHWKKESLALRELCGVRG